MESCEDTDFMYPMKADVYYPIVEQGLGFLIKQWFVIFLKMER